jgi:hypothetical protein
MTKFRAKISPNVLSNCYYPNYIDKCVGKWIELEDGSHGYYFGYLPKDNRKKRYCFGDIDLIDLEEIPET